jgi:hypothetical protein
MRVKNHIVVVREKCGPTSWNADWRVRLLLCNSSGDFGDAYMAGNYGGLGIFR